MESALAQDRSAQIENQEDSCPVKPQPEIIENVGAIFTSSSDAEDVERGPGGFVELPPITLQSTDESEKVENNPGDIVNESAEMTGVEEKVEDRLSSMDFLRDILQEESEKSQNEEFVPINAEMKVIGVEISDEEAKQLKNDIRRLSPVLVSLHERTLGEISLTSDSGVFNEESANQEAENLPHPLAGNEEIVVSDKVQVELGKIEDEKSVNSLECIDDSPDSKPSNSQKELLIVLSRVVVSPKTPSSEISSDMRSIECFNRDGENFNLSAKYMDNDQLSRKSPMVVIDKIADKVEPRIARNLQAEFAEQGDILEDSKKLNLPLSSSVEESRVVEVRESPDVGINREANSDNTELVSMTSVHLRGCEESVNHQVSRCDEPNSLICDEVAPGILTRLEAEQPEVFTEDSAESLALAASAGDEVRSDGSDSGLGSEIPGDPGPAPAPESDSETSFLDRIPDDILTDKEKVVNTLDVYDEPSSSTAAAPLPSFPTPQKSSLKRRLSDCMEGEPSAKRNNSGSEPARKKRNIQFDAVTVYYFPRSQGFTCVPSQGGSTLGMSATHTHAERFSLTEHAAEQRRLHRARVAQLRSERAANSVVEAASSSEDPSDDTDEEPSDTEDLDIDSYYFLQPVPTWQRRALLRSAGVRRIDAIEKDDCRDIRASREHCGCGCKGYCDPESCPCSRANVKCQVDRAGFPCGCSRDGCANSSGRIEFNPVRVRTHFIHTLMRLELEKKQRDEDPTEQEISRIPLRDGIVPNPVVDPSQNEPTSCINAGGFTTLHYENHEGTPSCQPMHPVREDSLDLYAIRDDCYPTEETVDNPHNSPRKLHPEFNQAFQPFPAQQQAFPPTNYQDYQAYETLPSTSRTQFQPQFPTVNQLQTNPNFSHYSPYVQDPVAMQQTSCHSQHPPQQIYETSFVPEENNSQQYTNLNSVQPMHNVVQQMGKLEPFSELLAGRYSYYGDVEAQPINSYHQNITKVDDKIEESKGIAENVEDCDENFGEIIKKSMVETVSA